MRLPLCQPPHDHPAIAIRDLTKIFHPPASGLLRRLLSRSHDKPVRALNQVNLTVERGEVFGLVGLNGQGKTTLIKCISSLLSPDFGSVSVLGHDTRGAGEEVKGLIGMVAADERSFYGRLTGWQNLMFFARLYGLGTAAARHRILELATLSKFVKMLPRRFHELSSGNKQRMAIIRALLIDPPLILLDEPTRSLDPIAADELRQILKDELNGRQGKTIFITSHNLDELESLCTRIGFLSRGELRLCASMAELQKSYFTIERTTLSLQSLPQPDGLLRLDVPFPPLEFTAGPEGTSRISFKRQVGDDTLNRIIQHVCAAGGKIIACDTERDGLRAIMDAFEASDRIEHQ